MRAFFLFFIQVALPAVAQGVAGEPHGVVATHGAVCNVFSDCGARPPPFLSSDALTACA